jgi:mono/diheme cytochrome c family protein
MRILTPIILTTIGFNFTVAESATPPTYERDIRPIFRAHCFDCHGATDELKGDLDLRLVRFIQKGGESGPAISLGAPNKSFLLERIRSSEMPPGEGTVSDAEIAIIEKWIATGAKTARPEPDSIGPGLGITEEERSFWSFQPLHKPEMPGHESFPEEARVRTPIDYFLLKAAMVNSANADSVSVANGQISFAEDALL